MSAAVSLCIDVLVVALVSVGASFVLIGSWGLVRLPSTMERLHAPTKATTLGIGSLVLASILNSTARLGIGSAHELLILLFLFVTAPISANMIAKVHLHRRRSEVISEPECIAGPPPRPAAEDGEERQDWATFERNDG